MTERHPIRQRGRPASCVCIIAVNSAIDLGPDRCRYARRRGKIHVRYPHRDGIRRLDARKPRDIVPFRGVCAAALYDAIKIKHEVTTLTLGQRNLDSETERPGA